MPAVPGVYKHYKGGLYRVLFLAQVSTNGPDEGKLVVVYVSLADGTIYSRDDRQFTEIIKHKGQEAWRFELLGEQKL